MDLIESGLEAREREKRYSLSLLDQLRRADDPDAAGGTRASCRPQARAIDLQCLSRSAISSARRRSSRPSRMAMSSGSART